MFHKGCRNTYEFTKFTTAAVHAFDDTVNNGIITMNTVKDEQEQLAEKKKESKSKAKTSNNNVERKKT